MSDACGRPAGERGGVVPRDTAERVHPEKVRLALDAAHAAGRRRERRRRRQHGLQRQLGAPRHDPGHVVRRRKPLPMLSRVIGGVFGAGVVIQVITLVPEASVAVSTSLADGLQLRDAARISLAVLAFAFFGGMGLIALRVALDRKP